MRVLHVIASLSDSHGGPANALVGLALAQRKQGMDVAICTGDVSTSRESDLKAAGIDVICFSPANRFARLQAFPSANVRTLVRGSNVVHIHGVWEHLLWEASTASAKASIPYVMRSCGMLDEWALGRKWFKKQIYIVWRLRRMLERAAAIHCTTHMEAVSTVRLGIRFPPIILEPNGVLIDEFEPLPARGTFREAHGIGNRPLIVFLGRVQPGKGVEYLLPALPLLKTQNTVLAIVGPDSSPFAAEMKRQAEALPEPARVIFTGMLRGRERIEALVDGDVFALPSEHENFGVSVVEALAAGSPVLVSDAVGLKQEVESAGVGSVTTLSPPSIAAALDQWLSRRMEIPRPFPVARRFAFDTFDWNQIAERWQSHYARLAS